MPICEYHANLRIANKAIYNVDDFSKVIYPELSYKITGIFFGAHNELGRFCNEKQYSDYIENHLKKLGIKYEREKVLSPSFDNELPGRNKIDFLVENKIVIEVKAKRILGREEYYQTRRYLKALGKKLGIIVNFREKYLRPKRVLNSLARE